MHTEALMPAPSCAPACAPAQLLDHSCGGVPACDETARPFSDQLTEPCPANMIQDGTAGTGTLMHTRPPLPLPLHCTWTSPMLVPWLVISMELLLLLVVNWLRPDPLSEQMIARQAQAHACSPYAPAFLVDTQYGGATPGTPD